MRLYEMADKVRYPRMMTAELRETFLLEGLFKPGVIELAYVDVDRTVIGSAAPTVDALTLEPQPELRAEVSALSATPAPATDRTETLKPNWS